VCSNDLALAVSRFCTNVSVSDNRLVTIEWVSAALVLYLKTAVLGCVTHNVIVEIFFIFGKIFLLEASHHF